MENLLLPYARACYNVAQESKQVDIWLAHLADIIEVLAKPSITEFLNDPALTAQNRAGMLADGLRKSKLPEPLIRMIELLIVNKKIQYLSVVQQLVQKFADQAAGLQRVEIVQAKGLSEAYQQKIIKFLERKLSGNIHASWTVDANLIGGFLVKVGDTVYDYSLRVRLEQLKKNILGK